MEEVESENLDRNIYHHHEGGNPKNSANSDKSESGLLKVCSLRSGQCLRPGRKRVNPSNAVSLFLSSPGPNVDREVAPSALTIPNTIFSDRSWLP